DRRAWRSARSTPASRHHIRAGPWSAGRPEFPGAWDRRCRRGARARWSWCTPNSMRVRAKARLRSRSRVTPRHRGRRGVSYSTRPRALPPAIGTPCRRGAGAFVLVAEIDAAASEIVGRDLHHHAVADAGADAELAHLARHVRENHVVVVEGDAVIAVGQHLGHRAVEFQQLFL